MSKTKSKIKELEKLILDSAKSNQKPKSSNKLNNLDRVDIKLNKAKNRWK